MFQFSLAKLAVGVGVGIGVAGDVFQPSQAIQLVKQRWKTQKVEKKAAVQSPVTSNSEWTKFSWLTLLGLGSLTRGPRAALLVGSLLRLAGGDAIGITHGRLSPRESSCRPGAS